MSIIVRQKLFIVPLTAGSMRSVLATKVTLLNSVKMILFLKCLPTGEKVSG